jgi:hypothetical protein
MSGTGLQGATRWFLYLLIASIAAGALLAIGIVLFGEWGWLEVRVLLTAGILAAGSVLGMACAAATGRVAVPALPAIGIGIVLLAGVLLLGGIWAEPTVFEYWKYTASVSILAVGSGHASLLSLARLPGSRRWVQVAAYAAIFAVAGTLIFIIFGEISDEGVFRLLAVLGIVDAAFTLVVPVVHFLSRGLVEDQPPMADHQDLAQIDAELARLRQRIAELQTARAAITHQAVTNEPIEASAPTDS